MGAHTCRNSSFCTHCLCALYWIYTSKNKATKSRPYILIACPTIEHHCGFRCKHSYRPFISLMFQELPPSPANTYENSFHPGRHRGPHLFQAEWKGPGMEIPHMGSNLFSHHPVEDQQELNKCLWINKLLFDRTFTTHLILGTALIASHFLI